MAGKIVTLITIPILQLSSVSDKVDILEGDLTRSDELEFENSRFASLKEAASHLMGSVSTQGVPTFISEVSKQIEHDTSVKKRSQLLIKNTQKNGNTHSIISFICSRIRYSNYWL